MKVNQYFILLLFFLLLSFSGNLFAERAVFDSLRAELSNTKNTEKQIKLEIQLAHWYLYINSDSVRFYLNDAIRKSNQSKNYITLCHAYQKYSALYTTFPELISMDSAFYYLDLAYNIAENNSYETGIAGCFFYKGFYLMQTENKDEAIENLIKARSLYAQLQDTFALIQTDYMIGDLYRMGGEIDKALTYFESIEKSKESRDWPYFPAFLEKMGITYESANKYNKSLEYYSKAYNWFKTWGDQCDLQRIYMKLAFVYQYLENSDSTTFYFNLAESYIDSCTNNGGYDNNYIILADICFNDKNFEKAEKYYLKSLEIARQNSWDEYELQILQKLSDFYTIRKDYNKALNYLQEYIHLKDSLGFGSLGSKVDNALNREELEEKKSELIRLKAQQLQMIKRKQVLIPFGILSLLMFCLAWYIHTHILSRFKMLNTELKPVRLLNPVLNQDYPSVKESKTFVYLTAFLYAILSLGTYFLLLRTQQGIAKILIWTIISCLAFIISKKIRRVNKAQTQSVKSILLSDISELLIVLVITLAVALSIHLIDFSFESVVYSGLTILSNCLLVKTIEIFYRHRIQFEILSDEMMSSFNLLLANTRKFKKEDLSRKSQSLNQISIDNNGERVDIDIYNLLYIVSANVYQEFYTMSNNKISKTLVRNTLQNLEKSLVEFDFLLRCHRSYIVNTQKVSAILGNSRQYFFILENSGEKIPISRTLASSVIEKFSYLLKN